MNKRKQNPDNTKLKNLKALFLDFQATSPNPENGHILEISWLAINNKRKKKNLSKTAQSYLITIDSDFTIPRHVSRLTGITAEDLKKGLPLEEVWKKLFDEAVLNKSKKDKCILVIHYSRYEEPFIKYLHEEYNSNEPYPFEIICTHEISKRLWPDLPRKGLRAIAGFLGYSVSELRRSTDHVDATVFIWEKIIGELKKIDITTLKDLQNWLSEIPAKKTKKKYPISDEKIRNLPDQPGIYRMHRSNNDILYVGKATSIKQRVKSYFLRRTKHAEHILEMLSQAVEISYKETNSALEAAMLETDEIKKISPQYNIALKERDRRIYYSNSRFNQFSENYSREFSRGPFISPDPFIAQSLIISLLKEVDNTEIGDETIETAMNLPPDYIPDSESFSKGLTLFKNNYNQAINSKYNITGFRKFGNILWEEKMARDEKRRQKNLEDRDLPEEEEDEELEEEWEWTPERVMYSLNAVVRHAFHMVRRAEWFLKISESALTWDKRSDCANRNILGISKSGIIHSAIANENERYSYPGDYKKTTEKRLEQFDLSDYDRLRVFTTELRRLVKERRNPVLSFNSRKNLKGNELVKTLKWV